MVVKLDLITQQIRNTDLEIEDSLEDETAKPITTVLAVKNLTYSYPKANEKALKDVSFTINQGEVFGFLGPSGAGKSTTQKILIRLIQSYTGSAQVFGKEISTWGQDYYEHLGVAFEVPNHFLKLTALENLQYFSGLFSGPKWNPMELLDLFDLANDAHKRVAEFSKGMKVRLGLARALINKPKLLFLDEPTNGLDPVNARLVIEVLQRLQKDGTTIFVTTHNMHVAETLCNRVAFIVNGEIKLIDTPANLKLRGSKRKLIVEYNDQDSGVVRKESFNLDGLSSNGDFLTILGKKILTLHSQEPSLDDVFVEITGRALD